MSNQDCENCAGYRCPCTCTSDCGRKKGVPCPKSANYEDFLAKRHHAGECWCDITHSVPEAARLNGTPPPEYDAMIQRHQGEEDPLVQEPKK